jgi:hypothetical protein
MITLTLFVSGVGLCLCKHPVWGSLCIAQALNLALNLERRSL